MSKSGEWVSTRAGGQWSNLPTRLLGKNDRIPLLESTVEKGSGTKTFVTASFANGKKKKKRKQLGVQAGNKQIMLIHATGYYAVIKIMFLNNFNDMRKCL